MSVILIRVDVLTSATIPLEATVVIVDQAMIWLMTFMAVMVNEIY